MAEFITKCPHCGGELQVQDEWIGMDLECPLCKKHFTLSAETPGCDQGEGSSDYTEDCDELSKAQLKKLVIAAVVLVIAIAGLLFTLVEDAKEDCIIQDNVVLGVKKGRDVVSQVQTTRLALNSKIRSAESFSVFS